MGSLNALIAVSLIYVAFLFGVAFAAERATKRGKGSWLQLPLVYTLSLSSPRESSLSRNSIINPAVCSG